MISITKNHVIVFDFDGTLVNSMADFGKIAADLISYNYDCKPQWAHQEYQKTSGIPFDYQIEEIFPQNRYNRRVAREFATRKKELYDDCSFYDDLIPTLQWLVSQGFRLAISSNNEQHLVKQKLGDLAEYFDMVLGFRPGFLKGRDHFRCSTRNNGSFT